MRLLKTYLTQTPYQWYLPVSTERREGYSGRSANFAWGDNVHEIPADMAEVNLLPRRV